MSWPWGRRREQEEAEAKIDDALLRRFEQWAATLSAAADDVSAVVEQMRANELASAGERAKR